MAAMALRYPIHQPGRHEMEAADARSARRTTLCTPKRGELFDRLKIRLRARYKTDEIVEYLLRSINSRRVIGVLGSQQSLALRSSTSNRSTRC
jgi:hypothetical protein